MIIPKFLIVYGDTSFRGSCAKEDLELMTFFNQLRKIYPDSYGLIAFHPKMEGKKSFAQAASDKMKGATKGVCDIIIPGSPTLCIEVKREDHTQSVWQPGQIDFLEAAHKNGAFVCLALGYKAALDALDDWIKMRDTK